MKSFNIVDLKIPVPVIEGGMGMGISLSGPASAVANMGGFEVISSVGIGFLEKTRKSNLKISHLEALKRGIQKALELTSEYKKAISEV